jgi:hypothetical protein
VRKAFAVLEAETARGRRGKGGVERLEADGLVGATFRHRTSRAGDPHLHTHVVIANLVHAGQDGRWSALDARPLYPWCKPVGYLYEAQLRAELTRRLGVAWREVKNGIADVEGFPQPTLRAFSQRRIEIEAYLAESGATSARAAQFATKATRRAKDPEVKPEGLLPEWRRRAEELGLDVDALAAVLHRGPSLHTPVPGSAEAEALFARLAGPGGLTAKVATFSRREVLLGICSALPQGGEIADILELAEAFLVSEHVVALGPPDPSSAEVIRLAGGRVVPAHTDTSRFTTPEMLATEAQLLDSALSRRDDGVGVAARDAVAAAIDERPRLSVEQAAMVRHLCESGAGVHVVVGVAGAGKTHALAAAREAWHVSGHHVAGAAIAARAAAELQAQTAIPSMTLDRLLVEVSRAEHGGFAPNTVVVVDEAAMVGTRKLAALLDHAQADGAKVVLVGDDRQLPAIDAGGAFAALARQLGAVELADNRRQREPWEREALAELRAGDVADALDAYQSHDRVIVGISGEEVREFLVRDWWAARRAGEPALMLASRQSEVDALNERARDHRFAADELGEELIVSGRGFAVGDEVLATRNNYRLGLLNGTRATVRSIDWEHCVPVLETTDGRRVVPLPVYLAEGHLRHGYATTIHKAQGATVAQGFVLGDDALYREAGYAALSRGREANTLYVVGRLDPRAEVRHAPEVEADPLDEVLASLKRSEAKTLARDERDAELSQGLEIEHDTGIDLGW